MSRSTEYPDIEFISKRKTLLHRGKRVVFWVDRIYCDDRGVGVCEVVTDYIGNDKKIRRVRGVLYEDDSIEWEDT